jgi:hypothetical protein
MSILPLKASINCFNVVKEIPEYPLAKTLILNANSILVFAGVKALPTPAAWDLIKFSCNSLKKTN